MVWGFRFRVFGIKANTVRGARRDFDGSKALGLGFP